ncbi:MAG TPA: transglycosylase SLT domain-containing protein [Thermodesulfovibrionales bacterium]|nr:transglycosylase SLT domain-containing protein [Thermodesulfovibrionales bacterium]
MNAPKIIEDYNSNKTANEAVKKHVDYFSDRIKQRFSVWLTRSGKYIEMMKGILKEQNVPEDMVFLPLIESGFNANAYSPAKAVGYWQFIASTAKNYGLEINWWKDERKDPVKSTVAAANYLKDLHQMFGSWNLAMAAYNAGEGKILRALNKSKADDYWSLLHTKYIRNETKDYVPKFIAASMIANSPEDFGFGKLEYHQPLSYDLVTIKTPVDVSVVADCAETSEEIIRELNPELRRWCTPADMTEYTLRIPEGKKESFVANLSRIPEENRVTVDSYIVRQGDTFEKISRKTGIPVQVILDLNDVEKIMPLKQGTRIDLPPKLKYEMDRDDRALVKKVSARENKKSLSGKHKNGKGKTKAKAKSSKMKSVKTASLKQKKDKA